MELFLAVSWLAKVRRYLTTSLSTDLLFSGVSTLSPESVIFRFLFTIERPSELVRSTCRWSCWVDVASSAHEGIACCCCCFFFFRILGTSSLERPAFAWAVLWVRMWRCMFPLVVKACPHDSHLKGLSPINQQNNSSHIYSMQTIWTTDSKQHF